MNNTNHFYSSRQKRTKELNATVSKIKLDIVTSEEVDSFLFNSGRLESRVGTATSFLLPIEVLIKLTSRPSCGNKTLVSETLQFDAEELSSHLPLQLELIESCLKLWKRFFLVLF